MKSRAIEHKKQARRAPFSCNEGSLGERQWFPSFKLRQQCPREFVLEKDLPKILSLTFGIVTMRCPYRTVQHFHFLWTAISCQRTLLQLVLSSVSRLNAVFVITKNMYVSKLHIRPTHQNQRFSSISEHLRKYNWRTARKIWMCWLYAGRFHRNLPVCSCSPKVVFSCWKSLAASGTLFLSTRRSCDTVCWITSNELLHFVLDVKIRWQSNNELWEKKKDALIQQGTPWLRVTSQREVRRF